MFGIGELQWINFMGSWVNGLHELLDALNNQKVPHTADKAVINPSWENYRRRLAIRVETGPDALTSNWLRIASVPNTVRYYHSPRAINHPLMEKSCRESATLAELHNRGFFSFAAPEEIERDFAHVGRFEVHSEHGLFALLEAGSDNAAIRPREAKNLLSSLFRRAWDISAASGGCTNAPMRRSWASTWGPLAPRLSVL